MVTANELLASLLEDTHGHPVVDKDARFKIDPDTRLIINTATNELYLVQRDHNSETYTFQLPRYVEGHDMMLCTSVVSHFNNIGTATGAENEEATENADVADLTLPQIDPDNPDMVICSWTIKRQSTQLTGILSFLIQFLCKDDDGNIVYEWHTDIFSEVTVKKGRNNGPAAVIEYTNILEQWREKLFGAGESVVEDIGKAGDEQAKRVEDAGAAQVSAVEAKGKETLKTIPDDYTETYNNARKALRTRANAIVNSAEGSVISVNDASDDYLRGLRVFGKSTQVTTTGKNLVNLPQRIAKPTSAYNYDLFTGTSGPSTAVSSEYLNILPYLQPGTYYFHVIVPEEYKDAGTKVLAVADDGTIDNLLLNECGSFTLTNPTRVTIRIGTNAACSVDDVQIESGSVYTGYESYSGGVTSPSPDWAQPVESIKNLTVDVHNKNLWNHEYDTVDLSSCTGWGNSIWNNDAVVRTLRPNTTYTMSFDVTALSIPEYETMFADNCGFTLFSSKASGAYIIMAQSIGEGVLKVGEKRSVKSTFTTPANLLDDGLGYGILRYTQRFIKADGSADYATVKFENIQLELGETATEYTDVNMQYIALTHTLPGIPVDSGGNYTDENGQQWICDEIDFERGVYVQRIGQMILTKDRTYYYNTDTVGKEFFYTAEDNNAKAWETRLYCSHFPAIGDSVGMESDYWMQFSGSGGIRFRHKDLTSLSSLTTWLSENLVTTIYILATPIETELTSAELAAYSELHSNYPTTTVMNDQGAHTEMKYNADTQTVFENTLRPTDAQVQAAVDAWLTAHFSSAEGVKF